MLLLLVVFFAPIASAQDRGYFALGGGCGFPVGDYASTDGTNSNAGFATQGFSYHISMEIKIGEYFCLGVLARHFNNGFDGDAYSSAISKLSNVSNVVAVNQPWKANMLLGGPQWCIPLDKGVNLEIKGLMGIINLTNPAIEITVSQYQYPPVNTVVANIANSSNIAFGGLLGLGFRFDITPYTCLNFNADYFLSNVDMQASATTSNGNSATLKGMQPVRTINIGLGFGFRFSPEKEPIKPNFYDPHFPLDKH